MVIADQYFSLGVGPPTGKSAKLFFLGTGSDICNPGGLGVDWNFPRLPSQAISSTEPAADDNFPTASVATICDGATAVPCGGDPAFATLHHSRHDIPSSTAERSSSGRFPTSHSGSWTAKITTTSSNYSTRWSESLTKPKKFPHLTKDLTDDIQHYHCDAVAKIVFQLKQGQALLPFDQKRLNSQVKGIYAGLVMVESKCIEVDKEQISQNESRFALRTSNTRNLTALHSTLLHEHHDFFLASQHPEANPALRYLASKYAMPARMWRHGIHAFFELLRHSMPYYLEHMLTFIYLAYTTMALLYETVPAFENTWIKCLGDLGRYRMAIEDDDILDRRLSTLVLQGLRQVSSRGPLVSSPSNTSAAERSAATDLLPKIFATTICYSSANINFGSWLPMLPLYRMTESWFSDNIRLAADFQAAILSH